MKNLKFVDPPAAYRRTANYDWDTIAPQLKANPTQWALLAEQAPVSVRNAIDGGKINNFHPSQGFEVTTANNNTTAKPRVADIFVRYNPETDTSLTVKEREKIMVEVRKAARQKNTEKENEA